MSVIDDDESCCPYNDEQQEAFEQGMTVGYNKADQEITSLRQQLVAAQKDAERWRYCIEYGFPIRLQTGWWGALMDGRLIGGKYPGLKTATEAIDAAIKEQS